MNTTNPNFSPKWIRFLSLIIDIAFVITIGKIVGFIFKKQLVLLGPKAVWIGFAIFVLYHGILSSSINKGRTLGKIILDIKTIQNNGKYIAIWKSLLRSAILFFPFYQHEQARNLLPNELNEYLETIHTYIIDFIRISLIYLFFFNRSTYQNIHDFILSTNVVSNSFSGQLQKFKFNKIHFLFIVVVVFSLSMIIPNFVSRINPIDSNYYNKNHLLNMNEAYEIIENIDGVISCKVTDENKNISILASVKRPDLLNQNLALIIARVAFKNLKLNDEKKTIAVTIGYGYDIGIDNSWDTYTFETSQTELNELNYKKN